MRLGAPDLWTGFVLMGLAGLYYAASLAIPESLLSDEVGASGLPKLLAVGLGLAGALLAVRSQAAADLRAGLARKWKRSLARAPSVHRHPRASGDLVTTGASVGTGSSIGQPSGNDDSGRGVLGPRLRGDDTEEEAGSAEGRWALAMEPRALGLIGAMAAYIALLPVAGYPLALAALVAGVALLAGARPTIWLAVTALAAGVGFWLVFARLFHIAVPAGIFARGF